MDIQDRYDDLTNLVDSLIVLADEVDDLDYKERLKMIQYDAENELEEVSKELEEQYRKELEEEEREYWKGVI